MNIPQRFDGWLICSILNLYAYLLARNLTLIQIEVSFLVPKVIYRFSCYRTWLYMMIQLDPLFRRILYSRLYGNAGSKVRLTEALEIAKATFSIAQSSQSSVGKKSIYLFYMQIKVEAATRGSQSTQQAIAPQVCFSQLDEDRRSAQSLRPDEHQGVATECTHKNLLRLVW